MGSRRAAVLVAVHVLIAIHVAQWLFLGTTLSPVEPSESMQTLRDGLVNAGLVMFVLAIGSTLVVGRFFCGWACHVVAVQDLCGYLMKRLGVRPKPFRSRVLLWAPLALAAYMFAWPVLHREVITPLLADSMGRLPAWLGHSRPWPGVQAAFLVQDFWATFPAWYVAVPFFAVCGFGCVYFLGSKGFCTYVCPYGGVFGPVDRLAPGRIRVNDNCHQCGHCTAVCTSNVRVHEEVRDFGMVIDPGCMKCMDCVSVCPKGALSLSFGAPAMFRSPRVGRENTAAAAKASRQARYDPSLFEDLCLGLLMLVLVLSFRGMFNQVPLLMAAGLGVIGAFGAWMLWRTARVPNVRVQSVQLRLHGRMKFAGWVFAIGAVALLAAAAWSGAVRLALWQADHEYARLQTPLSVVLAPEYVQIPAERNAAARAVRLYRLADAPDAGGFGWRLRPDDLTNLAFAHLVLGQMSEAERVLRALVERGRPADGLVFQLADIMKRRGAAMEEIGDMLARALERQPTLPGVRSALARGLLIRGDRAGATYLWDTGLAEHPDSIEMSIEAARFSAAEMRDVERTRAIISRIDERNVKVASRMSSLAQLEWMLGDQKAAQEWARRAAKASLVRAPSGGDAAASDVLEAVGLRDEAIAHARATAAAAKSRGRYVTQADAILHAGLVERRLGDPARGLALVREALAIVEASPWDLLSAAQFAGTQASGRNDRELGTEAEAAAKRAQTRIAAADPS